MRLLMQPINIRSTIDNIRVSHFSKDSYRTPLSANDMGEWGSLIASLVSSPHSRSHTADELVRLGDKRTVPTVIAFLKNEDEILVICCMRLLARKGDERAVEPLIKILNSTNPRLRKHATDALENIGESAVGPLIIVLERALLAREDAKRAEWPPLRHTAWSNLFIAAARALGGIGDERAIGPLESAIKEMVDAMDDKTWNGMKTLIQGWFESHPGWEENVSLIAVPQLVAAGDAKPDTRKALYAAIRTCFADIADDPFRSDSGSSMPEDKDMKARDAAEIALRRIRHPSKFTLSDNSE